MTWKTHYLSAVLVARLQDTYGEVKREDPGTFLVDVQGEPYRVIVQAVPEAGPGGRRWVEVGDVLHGGCQGAFGRDATGCMRVEGVSPEGNWVVARGVTGWQSGTHFMAKDEGIAGHLRYFRRRLDEYESGTVCCEESSCPTSG